MNITNDFLNKLLCWERLRALGELQLLTRASYVALIVVPLVASLWPTVRIVVNKYNATVIEATKIFEDSRQSLQESTIDLERVAPDINKSVSDDALVIKVAVDRIRNSSNNLQSMIDLLVEGITPQTLDTPKLPRIWVFAFLGSLFIVIAHTIYQSAAPGIIRAYSKLDFLYTSKKTRIETGFDRGHDSSNQTPDDILLDLDKTAGDFYQRASDDDQTVAKILAALFYGLGIICIFVVGAYQLVVVVEAAF